MVFFSKKLKLKSIRTQRRKLLRSTFSQVPKKKKYPSSSINIKILRIIIVVVFLILAYLFIYYPYFQIKSVVVVDHKIVDEEKIEDIAWSVLNKRRYVIFPGKNTFFFNKQTIKKTIEEQIPEINSVEIIRKFPDIIKVKVQEAKPAALWKSGDNYYYLDQNGVVRGGVSDLGKFSEEGIFTINDLNNKDVQIKENVVYAKHINFIKALYEKLPEIKINIKEVALPSPLADEVHVTTENDWRVFFTLERDLDQQISNLQLVFENEISNKLTEEELNYVDLRVESWVYYRRRMASDNENEEDQKEENIEIDELVEENNTEQDYE
jgi:cell division septal protein FtsQ